MSDPTASPSPRRARCLKARPHLLWLLAILVLGVGLRCIHLTDPYIADFHAWRQADTAAFTHGYLIETFNPLSPRVDRQPCSLADAPFGLVEAELPIAAWIAAVPLKALGLRFPPAWYLRLVSIAFYVATAIYIWRLALLLGARRAEASLATLAFSTFPLSVFFTRTPQPDGPALFFSVAFLFYLERWLRGQADAHASDPRPPPAAQPIDSGIHTASTPGGAAPGDGNASLALCGLMGACMLLIKISNAFIGVPAAYLVVSSLGLRRALTSRRVWLLACAVLGAGAAWYAYAHGFPWTFGIWGDRAASKFATWELINSAGVWATLSHRLAFPIAGWAALLLAGVGLGAGLGERRVRLCVAWLLAFAAFVVLVLRGNDTHIYYQLPCVLPLALLAGRGAAQLWGVATRGGRAPGRQTRWVARAGLLGLVALQALNLRHVMFSKQTRGERRGFYHLDINGVDGAQLLRRSLPPGARFVSADRNPVLFYNSQHQGFFAEDTSVPALLRCAAGRADHILVPRSYAGREHKYRRQIQRSAASTYFLLWEVRRPPPP